MNAITLHQPWASLCFLRLRTRGGRTGESAGSEEAWAKTIETRRHPGFASLEGKRVAVHAGKTWDDLGAIVAAGRLVRAGFFRKREDAELLVRGLKGARGVVVGTARVARHRRLTGRDSDAALCDADGLWGLVLADQVPRVPPEPARGRQGIWEWAPWRERKATE